ncbi:MAG TPA: M56 family metallopeptidase [Verrucomicrobiae bacterium]|jgi:beta-lactamase regulating signal transducer with metallopeptidase domain|nr:M56 family metallopeptidase [Verrucomicrobiae bacterium]
MTLLHLQFLPQVLAERFLNTAPSGLVFAALVWMLLRFAGRANSETRFAVWFSALMALAVFPFLPAWTLISSSIHSSAENGAVVLSGSWAFYLFAAWALGAAALLFRLAWGLWRVGSVRRNCTELDFSSFDSAIDEILRNSGKRQVSLCTSEELAVPAAIGLFRPAIVFPASLLPHLSTGEIEMIVRHELAHLCRWDDWTNLVQKIVKAVFFFHPAVWWIENRLTLEREIACDDVVLAQTQSPRAYASSLISFAEKLHTARALAMAQALVSRMQQMSVRIEQILDTKRPTGTRAWRPVVALGAGLLILTIGAAPFVPRLIAFQTGQADAHTAQPFTAAVNPGPDHMARSRAIEVPVALRTNEARQPKAIPVLFHPRELAVQPQLPKKDSGKPPMLRAAAVGKAPVEQTIFIVRTVRYDISGPSSPQVWTLCIWTVDGNGANVRQLESAIVASSI